MSFSRISIVEYNSAEDVEICMDRYREVAPIIFGAAEYLCVTMIGPETAHFLAVYPNQQLAEHTNYPLVRAPHILIPGRLNLACLSP